MQNIVNQFLWKAAHDKLPTRENLLKKKITETDLCLVCERETETTIHALWSYPAANDVWGETNSPVKKWSSMELHFLQLWKRLNDRLNSEDI